jgi:hypothetical protein
MIASQTGLRPQARNRRPDITTVLGSFRWARAAASSSSSCASLAKPMASTCGRMLRIRSMRAVQRVSPAGYNGALPSTSTSVRPAWRNSSGTPAADAWVSAVAGEGHREDLTEPREGGGRRIAEGVFDVVLDGRQPATRPGQPDHLSDHRGWLGEGDQQGPGVHQVERAGTAVRCAGRLPSGSAPRPVPALSSLVHQPRILRWRRCSAR